jgi:putative inorganic carbon (HCO3(-)) transporter
VAAPRPGWRSSTPYRDTLGHLVDGQAGTGRGRLIQYAHTVDMIGEHPLLGVGPGNWSAAYPRYASTPDPSYDPRALRPVNRLPNSDWLGLLAERGLLVALLLVAAGVEIVRGARRLSLDGGTLLACAAGALVTGMFDAVLLRPEPLYLLCASAGALATGRVAVAPRGRGTRALFLTAAAAGVLLVGSGAVTAARQIGSLVLRERHDPGSQEHAAALDPGEYSLLAEIAVRAALAGDCGRALDYAGRARALFPAAGGLTIVERRCPVDRPTPATASLPF